MKKTRVALFAVFFALFAVIAGVFSVNAFAGRTFADVPAMCDDLENCTHTVCVRYSGTVNQEYTEFFVHYADESGAQDAIENTYPDLDAQIYHLVNDESELLDTVANADINFIMLNKDIELTSPVAVDRDVMILGGTNKENAHTISCAETVFMICQSDPTGFVESETDLIAGTGFGLENVILEYTGSETSGVYGVKDAAFEIGDDTFNHTDTISLIGCVVKNFPTAVCLDTCQMFYAENCEFTNENELATGCYLIDCAYNRDTTSVCGVQDAEIFVSNCEFAYDSFVEDSGAINLQISPNTNEASIKIASVVGSSFANATLAAAEDIEATDIMIGNYYATGRDNFKAKLAYNTTDINYLVTVNDEPLVHYPLTLNALDQNDPEDSVVYYNIEAEVNGEYFGTLEEAIAVANANDTVNILDGVTNTDATTANVRTININKNIVLEGNNNSISNNTRIIVGAQGATIRNIRFMNIHNDATPTAQQITYYGFVDKVGTLTAIYAQNLAGELNIENCLFDGMDWEAIQVTPVAGAEINITGNTFRAAASQTVRYVHIQSAKNVDFSANVTGNKMYNGSLLKETGLEVYYPADMSKIVLSGNYIAEPTACCVWAQNGTEIVDAVLPFATEDLEEEYNPVAYVTRGNTYYFETVQDAINFANANETVVLLEDCELTSALEVDKNLTINLNGYSVSAEQGVIDLAYNTADAELVLENGTVESLNRWAIYVQNGGKLTVNQNVTVKSYATGDFATITVVDGGKVDIYGNVIAENNFAISGNGTDGQGNIEINIYSGSLVSCLNGIAIYMPNSGELNISGGAVIGKVAVYIKSGTTTISGGVLTGNGELEEYAYNGNGANSTGDAVVIDACGYPGGNPTVTISYGDFVSMYGKSIGYYHVGTNTATIAITGTSATFSDDSARHFVTTPGKTILYDESEEKYVITDGKVQNTDPLAVDETGKTPEQIEQAKDAVLTELVDTETPEILTENDSKQQVKDIIAEAVENKAVNQFIDPNLTTSAGENAIIKIDMQSVSLKKSGEDVVVTGMAFEVKPFDKFMSQNISNDNLTGAITFRLPVSADITAEFLKVTHNGDDMGFFPVKTENQEKYIEITTPSFSVFAWSVLTGDVNGVAAVGTVGYTTFQEAINAAVLNDGDICLLKDCNENVTYPCTFDFTYEILEDVNFTGTATKTHTEVENTVYPATCTHSGIKLISCANCNYIATETIEMLEHSYEAVAEVPATCEHTGVYAHYKCTVCGKLFIEDVSNNKVETTADALVIELQEHTYGTWIEEVAPTTSTYGVVGHYHCSVCGKDFDSEHNELKYLYIGKTGTNGATWTVGLTAPNNADGQNGDFYLNSATWDVYTKTSGVWSTIGNIKGLTGMQGATGPQGATGMQGATGPQGSAGTQWHIGAVAPNNLIGVAGDFYLNTTTYDLYQKVGNVWQELGNIKGADGASSGSTSTDTTGNKTPAESDGEMSDVAKFGLIYTAVIIVLAILIIVIATIVRKFSKVKSRK